MNDTYELRSGDTHIEVHKFFPGAVAGVALVTLILQASFPVYIPKLDILDLPLLITIYFGLSRRNPSTGRRKLSAYRTRLDKLMLREYKRPHCGYELARQENHKQEI